MRSTEPAAPDGAATTTLTFDDGPDPVWTPRVLAELSRRGATAVFFVIAPRARAHPHLIDAMLADGHEVGLHCWDHVRHGLSARGRIEADTDRALTALDALGVRVRRWRTPWGDTAPWSAAVAAERGLRIEGWAADTHDWRGDDAATMLAAVLPGLAAGGTVLMHDGIGPGARRRDCRETVRLIAPLCAAVRAGGGVVAGRPRPAAVA